MDNAEFIDWLALESIDPLPDHWHMTAMLCQLLANIHRGKGKPYQLDDFMPVKRSKPQSEAQLKASLRRFVKSKS